MMLGCVTIVPMSCHVALQVGDLYGLKGERVRQIEGVAIAMLKKGLQQGLRKTLEDTQVD